ncbi:MAG TPA: hypothetical protein PLV45_10780 [bacterium]|nr:hypothetical protein [bacterium]
MRVRLILLSGMFLMCGISFAAIVADHTCTDIDAISEAAVSEACGMFRIYYGHTSHGSQIMTGMDGMENRYGAPWRYNESGAGGELSVHEVYGDLGHNGDTAWAGMTRDELNNPDSNRNVVMWSWCGGVSDNTPEGITTYLNTMNQLEASYPDVLFIYMTGHLDGSGESGNLHQRNEQIRAYCMANNKILFDFADIESYNPDGEYFLNRGADDGCYYNTGNWAEEWCAEHPLSDLCLDCDCAHSMPLNCNLKGRAFWWLLAELTGAAPQPTPTPAPPEMGVEIEMPGHLFRSSDICYCSVTVTNTGIDALENCPLFVILVAYDYLFWAPSFSDFDSYLALYPAFPPGETVVEVIPEFMWPPVDTAGDGLYFIAAITDPEIQYLLGNADIWEFGWTDY